MPKRIDPPNESFLNDAEEAQLARLWSLWQTASEYTKAAFLERVEKGEPA